MPIWVPQFSNSASVIELWNHEKSLRMNSESIIGKLTLKSLGSTIFLQWLVVVFWKWEKSCVLFFGSNWQALNLPGCMRNTFSEAWPNAGKIVNHTVDLFSHVEWISFRKTTRWNVSRKVPKITTTVINGRQPLKCVLGQSFVAIRQFDFGCLPLIRNRWACRVSGFRPPMISQQYLSGCKYEKWTLWKMSLARHAIRKTISLNQNRKRNPGLIAPRGHKY